MSIKTIVLNQLNSKLRIEVNSNFSVPSIQSMLKPCQIPYSSACKTEQDPSLLA